MSGDKNLHRRSESRELLVRRPLKWFAEEAISNFLYDQLGALWRSAAMTTMIAVVLRSYSKIPLDVRLIIGLFTLALIFFSIEHGISKRRDIRIIAAANPPSVPPVIETANPGARPKAYLIPVMARLASVSVSESGRGWVKSGRKNSVEAITASFNNVSGQTLRYVVARVAYYRADGGLYHQVNKGEWLEERGRYVEIFSVGESRELMLAWRLSNKEVFASGDNDRQSLNPAGNQLWIEVNFVAGMPERHLQKLNFKLTLEPTFSIEQVSSPLDGVTENDPARGTSFNIGGEECPEQWLHSIAEEDNRDVSKAVFVILKDVDNCLSDPIPRIYFTFTAFNGSVYSLTIDPSVEGEIRCRKKSLMGAMKVDGFKNLAHGSPGDFTLTFEPTPAGASFIQEAQKIGEDWFWLDQLRVRVKGGDDCQELAPQLLNLPHTAYSTDQKERFRILKDQHESEKDEWRRRANIIAALSEVLGMAEGLMRIYKLPNSIPPEHIEEWRQRLQATLRHCYGGQGIAKFYPFNYEGKTIAGPKENYAQDRWFEDHVNRLKEIMNGVYEEQ